MNIDTTLISEAEIEGVDMKDYPDFCDAFITSGTYQIGDGEWRDLTEEELEFINSERGEFVHEQAHETLH